MQQIITAKLKLKTTPEQHQLLRQTQLTFRDALNHVSRYAFAHGKVSSAKRLHQGTYDDVRLLFGLPSQMACSVMRQVGSTYKGLWTKPQRYSNHRRAKNPRKRSKELHKAPNKISPTETNGNGHDT